MPWSLALALLTASLGSAPQPGDVSGIVTINEQPLANQLLVLTPADLKSPRITVRTDANGRYVARVDRDAVHLVVGAIDGRTLVPMDVRLAPGRTDANVSYSAGILHLRAPKAA